MNQCNSSLEKYVVLAVSFSVVTSIIIDFYTRNTFILIMATICNIFMTTVLYIFSWLLFSVSMRDPDNDTVLIEGVLFRARYLGSTTLISEGQPSKAMRMMQAQEAVGRIKVRGRGMGEGGGAWEKVGGA